VIDMATAVALLGLTGQIVEIEVDITPGLPASTIIGFPDTARVIAMALFVAARRISAASIGGSCTWLSWGSTAECGTPAACCGHRSPHADDRGYPPGRAAV
jgi:hypothetical protein